MSVNSVRKHTAIVAVACLVLVAALPAVTIVTRAVRFRREASRYSELEHLYRDLARVNGRMVAAGGGSGAKLEDVADRLASFKEFEEHYARMRRKYERAAGRPWARVEADPPWPKVEFSTHRTIPAN